MASSQTSLDFRRIETWVFDLDNTLYAASERVFDQVDRRMRSFIADFLKVDETEAHRLQKLYYHEYGTTLSGLMAIHNLEPKAFLDYVHDIDASVIAPNPALDKALCRLPGRKVVYTNGSHSHAENVLDRIGIQNHFSDIYDIVAADYVPKPERRAYEHIFAKARIEPGAAVMFEDIVRNLEAAHALGMTTVWVRPVGADIPDLSNETGDVLLADHPHVHHVTDDLTAFLDRLSVA